MTGPKKQATRLPREVASYPRRRARGWWIGMTLMGLGVATVVDFFHPLPIPLVGLPAFLVGAVSAAMGFLIYRRSRRMPVAEALRLAACRGGRLTKMSLVVDLRLEPGEAEELLDLLIRERLLEVDLDLDVEEKTAELPADEEGYRVIGLTLPEDDEEAPETRTEDEATPR